VNDSGFVLVNDCEDSTRFQYQKLVFNYRYYKSMNLPKPDKRLPKTAKLKKTASLIIAKVCLGEVAWSSQSQGF
jgi:hypothetical protein